MRSADIFAATAVVYVHFLFMSRYGDDLQVASLIGGVKYGVAKKAQLVSVRVMDCWGDGYWSDIVAGVEWVMRDRLGTVSAVLVSCCASASVGSVSCQ